MNRLSKLSKTQIIMCCEIYCQAIYTSNCSSILLILNPQMQPLPLIKFSSLRKFLLSFSNMSADGHSKASRHSQPIINQNYGGTAKSILCNHWGECVHEDWGWIMVPNWQRVVTCNLWPRICSMAEVIMLPNAISICISIFGARRLGWGLVSPYSHFIYIVLIIRPPISNFALVTSD